MGFACAHPAYPSAPTHRLAEGPSLSAAPSGKRRVARVTLQSRAPLRRDDRTGQTAVLLSMDLAEWLAAARVLLVAEGGEALFSIDLTGLFLALLSGAVLGVITGFYLAERLVRRLAGAGRRPWTLGKSMLGIGVVAILLTGARVLAGSDWSEADFLIALFLASWLIVTPLAGAVHLLALCVTDPWRRPRRLDGRGAKIAGLAARFLAIAWLAAPLSGWSPTLVVRVAGYVLLADVTLLGLGSAWKRWRTRPVPPAPAR